MGRKLRPLVRAALVVGLSTFTLNSAWPEDSSATYQITPAHTGAVELVHLNLPLKQAWVTEFHGRLSYPVVAGGKAFVFVADSDVGRPAPEIAALGLNTGQVLWTSPVRGPLPAFAGLAYANGKLFAIDGKGLLRALNPSTGTELWAKQLSDPRYSSFRTAPTAANGMVYVTGETPSNSTLYAVNASDGNVMWRQQVYGDGNSSVPTFYGDSVSLSYVCSFYHFDAVTGEARWYYELPISYCSGGGGMTAVSYAGRLFTSGDIAGLKDTQLVFDIATGKLIRKVHNVYSYPPAIRGGIGYFTGVRNIRAISVLTGQELWRFTDIVEPAFPPIVVNGNVLFPSQSGKIFVLDGVSGNTLQTISLGPQIPQSGLDQWIGFGAGTNTILAPVGKKLFALKGTAP